MTGRAAGGAAGAAAEAVLGAIDGDALVDLASELVEVATVSGAERPGQETVAGLLERAGMDVTVWDIDMAALAEHPRYSAEFDRDDARGVLGVFGGGAGRTLLFDGHIDVVPPGDPDRWTTPAFAPNVRDGRLWGRGACDMKGGLAAAIHAVDALRRAGVDLAGSVALASVVGEEDGGSGTLALLERGLHADGCVIMEPTDLAVCPAAAGALSWRVRIRGQSAHGCLREEGVSAIEKFHPVHRAVLDLERRRNENIDGGELFGWLERPFAICGGRIAGGDWPSSEADWVTWEGRYGVAPGEDLDVARRQFEAAVADAAHDDPWLAEHPPEVEWWGGQFLPGRTDTDDAVVSAVVGAARDVLGRDVAVRGMPYGCDLGLTVNVGDIPTVVCGPGDIRDAHRPDESVAVADLIAAARVYALTILGYCAE